jgi:hypothetical protein
VRVGQSFQRRRESTQVKALRLLMGPAVLVVGYSSRNCHVADVTGSREVEE